MDAYNERRIGADSAATLLVTEFIKTDKSINLAMALCQSADLWASDGKWTAYVRSLGRTRSSGMTSRVSDLPRKWLGRCPTPSNIFIVLGMGLSIFVAIAAQIPGLEMVHSPFDALLVALIAVLAIVVSLAWTSCHWFFYGLISIRYPSRAIMGLFGVVLLGVDAYIRITAVFFPTSSTSAVAVMFIPILLGVVVLPPYWGAAWLGGRFQPASHLIPKLSVQGQG